MNQHHGEDRFVATLQLAWTNGSYPPQGFIRIWWRYVKIKYHCDFKMFCWIMYLLLNAGWNCVHESTNIKLYNPTHTEHISWSVLRWPKDSGIVGRPLVIWIPMSPFPVVVANASVQVYAFSETKPQMLPMDLNIGETRVWLWFRAKSTTLWKR